MAYLGISQEEMARLFKVSTRTWRNWMTDTDQITVGRMRIIAKRLGTTVGELIREEV